MKTIGTLEEIGAHVGDVVTEAEVVDNCTFTIMDGQNLLVTHKDGHTHTLGRGYYWDRCKFRIVTRADKSPVRTVTRKEIVPGIYGKVSVHQLRPDNGGYYIAMVDSLTHKESTVHSPMTEADLTAAIKTLTEIRDAMENP